MTIIVLTDFLCWFPICVMGVASLGGARVPPQVYAWVAVFVLPLNSAVNPILYTISTTAFLTPAKKGIRRIRFSFRSSHLPVTNSTSVPGTCRSSHIQYVWPTSDTCSLIPPC